jgi:diguanylate cyclase (GGDEF)-like protein
LARSPDLELAELAEVISRDPGLAARVLRIANSSFYARRRHVANLRDALVVLGINAAISLALGFSLVQALGSAGTHAGRYTRFWSRSLLAAHAAEELGRQLKVGLPENAFLAALVQDIGILAMDQALGEEYLSLVPQDGAHEHDRLVAAERGRFGTDHAEVGAWLLARWDLPESLRVAVAASHGSEPIPEGEPGAAFRNCIALSGYIADAWLARDHHLAIETARIKAADWLGLGSNALGRVLEAVSARIPEASELYGIGIADEPTRAAVLEEAAELLLLHSLRTAEEARENLRRAERLEAQTRAIEEQARRDSLTGIFNRRHLDTVLRKEFTHAVERGWPLSLVFVDLDHFKGVNDTFGHQVGDKVLTSVAHTLREGARRSDILGRYGGEEFVLVLPATGRDAAAIMAQRLIDRIAEIPHAVVEGRPIRMTASAGLATHSKSAPFHEPETLVRRADAALYRAKLGGRNRLVVDGDDRRGDQVFAVNVCHEAEPGSAP